MKPIFPKPQSIIVMIGYIYPFFDFEQKERTAYVIRIADQCVIEPLDVKTHHNFMTDLLMTLNVLQNPENLHLHHICLATSYDLPSFYTAIDWNYPTYHK